MNVNAEDSHSAQDIFRDVYFLVLFFACLWFVGKISARLGLPALVGEIITGIILGPYLLDLVPHYDALKIIGDIGLLFLVLEAGIDVNMGILKVVGTNGLMIAVFGSLFPLLIGSFLALAINPTIDPRTAAAIGACFAPTSMGIAINVLRNGKILNTPTGQLIIAAAVLDDVIALILLSVLQEFAGSPEIVDILICILVSPVLILVFGFIAIRLSPSIIRSVMDKIDIRYHEYAILLMLFCSMLVLVPACFYAKSSYLLGAFLSGLMFCTDHTMHHVWEKQMKKIMHWLLRIFFACTIGFEVPIKDFVTNPKVVTDAVIYFAAIIGKLATGVFATSRPIQISEFLTIAFSMSAWGEFAFILATSAYASGLMEKDTMTAILMAVLLSVIIAPLFLRITLQMSQKKKEFYVIDTRKSASTIHSLHRSERVSSLPDSLQTIRSDSSRSHPAHVYLHNVYYCIHTKSYGTWGHQNRLLKAIYSLNLEIIDFRAFNQAQNNESHYMPYVQDIFYVKDNILQLFPSKQLNSVSKKKLSKRVKSIRNSIKLALRDENAQIEIMRWLPGIKKRDDLSDLAQSHSQNSDIAIETKKKKPISVAYVRNQAYKQARFALSSAHLPRWRDLNNANVTEVESKMPEMNTLQRPTRGTIAKTSLGYSHQHRGRVSYMAGNVHSQETDELVKLKIETGELIEFDLGHTMSVEIMYADEHSSHSQEMVTPIKVVKWTSPTANPNPNTPLLKGSEE